jgi:Reverse transcriptase (RNA-dependent DNA polymerase)
LLGHTPDQVVMACCCQLKENLQSSAETPKRLTSTKCSPAATQKRVILASLILESEQVMGEVITDEDKIDDSRNDSFSPRTNSFPDTDPLSLIHIAGDTDQQNKLRLLCNEFRDIFSNELPASPANIPPFDLTVEDTKWKVSRNRTPPRPQSAANQADIARQIAVLKKQGIIEKSNAAYSSQVLMVPNPDGTKRMCIDFRNLNDCTEDASWPIPHITEMLRRIGSHEAKIVAVLDLTQVYHQAPLTLAAHVYTAFILFCGVYQFTRLPFGPKRAPSYFQQTMATVVLAGLIYIICEMYIDDCNVFAKDIDELVVRLRLIFERFRKHNIFVKA